MRVNADLRQHRGLRQLPVRGFDKALCIGLWMALVYNVIQWIKLSPPPAARPRATGSRSEPTSNWRRAAGAAIASRSLSSPDPLKSRGASPFGVAAQEPSLLKENWGENNPEPVAARFII